jgi:hypothetical protein
MTGKDRRHGYQRSAKSKRQYQSFENSTGSVFH